VQNSFRSRTTWRTCICSDSRAVIAALAESTTESVLVWENIHALEKISGTDKVTIVWIPGHHEIPEYEEAVKLAKEGTNKVYVDQTAGSPFAVDKHVIKCHLRQECLNRWKTCKVLRHSTTLMSEQKNSRQWVDRSWKQLWVSYNRPTRPQNSCLYSDSHSSTTADCAETKQKISRKHEGEEP